MMAYVLAAVMKIVTEKTVKKRQQFVLYSDITSKYITET